MPDARLTQIVGGKVREIGVSGYPGRISKPHMRAGIQNSASLVQKPSMIEVANAVTLVFKAPPRLPKALVHKFVSLRIGERKIFARWH